MSNRDIYRELLNRMKILAGIPTIKNLPVAEGKFSYTLNGKELSARVSLISTAFGERATLRLFSDTIPEIGALGLSADIQRFLAAAMDDDSGGILGCQVQREVERQLYCTLL